MADEVRKRYEELKKRHKLPKFEELEGFQISDLEETEFLLSEIRGKIGERLDACREFFSELLNPDTDPANMYESRVFSDAEKKEVFDVFKRLMFWTRASLEVSISDGEAANAEFIKGFLEEWKGLKTKLEEIIASVKNSWEKESEETEKLGYFG